MREKDYFKILGVEENASQSEIKEAYRNLSKKYHPDRCPSESERQEYEEKFKEINEAYDVLSNEEKRQAYLNQGKFNPFDFGGFGDFGDFFNPFRHVNPKKNNTEIKGETLRLNANVTIEDIFNNKEYKYRYKRFVKCNNCQGTGKTSETVEEKCPNCKGKGVIIQTYNQGFSVMQQVTPCSHCNGTGAIYRNPCPNCNGNKRTLSEDEITFKAKDLYFNKMLLIKGAGNEPINGNMNGDVMILPNYVQDSYFDLEELDVIVQIAINFTDACLGGTIKVKYFNDTFIDVTIKPNTKVTDEIAIEGKGISDGRGNVGKFICYVSSINIPTNLTDKEKELLLELKEQPNFKQND